MRLRVALLSVLVCLAAFTVWYVIKDGEPGHADPGSASAPAKETPASGEIIPAHNPVPVASNRGPEVADGFRGDVHPLLFGRTRLEVAAHWTTVGQGRDKLHRTLNPMLYEWFTSLRPAQALRTYTQGDFSGFLPETIGEAGQLWALDGERIVRFLRQFHAKPSLHIVATGRRAGPDGAFAILRAVSPAYLNIAFRIHAEFYLTPEDWPVDRQLIDAWYTPAYLSGRVLVNRSTGTVEHFRLGLPTDKTLNVHLTVHAKGLGDAHDVVRVDRMELAGGEDVANISWTQALAAGEAERRLAKVFFKFLEIEWTPFDQVVAQARSQGRPIFAVVSWGAFDDQSC